MGKNTFRGHIFAKEEYYLRTNFFYMKKIISLSVVSTLVLLGFQSFKLFTQDDTWNNCFKKYRSNWGESCSSCQVQKDTYKVYMRNECDVTVDAVVAVQETTKRWKYYSYKKMAPGDSASAYACVGTGKYLKYVKPSSSTELILPTADQVNEQNPK